MNEPFRLVRPAKIVLAGEHTVLMGHPAVVLPFYDLSLTVQVKPSVRRGSPEWPVIWRELESEWVARDLGPPTPTSQIEIESTIPLGGGLGSSAALCSAFVEWKSKMRPAPYGLRDSWYRATQLESYFHGSSSGMDIAAVSLGQPILFSRGFEGEPWRILTPPERPLRFTLEDTGIRATTKLAVEKVRAFRELSSNAQKVDSQMIRAVELAKDGLLTGQPELMAQSMDLSLGAYREWGIFPSSAEEKVANLRQKGALGVRMTGSGRGGFLVALWPS